MDNGIKLSVFDFFFLNFKIAITKEVLNQVQGSVLEAVSQMETTGFFKG